MTDSTDSSAELEEYWVRDSWAFPNTGIGTDVLLLLSEVEKWVLRRIEKVQFIDDRTIRRQVTVDFELPLEPPLQEAIVRNHYLIPLALFSKEPLVGFDIYDESNMTLPILTRWENARVSWSMALALAKLTSEEDIPEDLARTMLRIIDAVPAVARRRLTRFFNTSDALVQRLAEDEDFRRLMSDLADNFVLIVPVKFEPGRRRIIKFSYVAPLELSSFGWQQRLGQEASLVRFDLPGIDEGASFHFEVEAPEGLDVYEGEIVRRSATPGGPEQRLAYVAQRSQRVHLYPRHVAPGAAAEARIWLLPTPAGLIRASFIFSLGVFLMMLVLFFRLPQASASAHSLLLTVPGLVGLFLIRPAENRLATRMLFWFRAVVSFSGFLPFAGSLLLLLDLPERPERCLWGGLAGLGLLAILVVGQSYAVSRKP